MSTTRQADIHLGNKSAVFWSNLLKKFPEIFHFGIGLVLTGKAYCQAFLYYFRISLRGDDHLSCPPKLDPVFNEKLS